MNESDQVAEFYQRELAQALNEQTFGISRSEIIHCNENEAEATITLLEGNNINVVLSSAGYKVLNQGVFYETLDDLLSSMSPAYAAKRVETLVGRLEGLVDKGRGS
ncbi:hypothetical protein F5888DRAFT_1645557 [Russula emetica]|nr:hypothetical protein F5888DRAFT_1645557 [Russula emetica]